MSIVHTDLLSLAAALSPFTCEPVWRLNDVSLRNVETMEIIGNVFNSKGNNTPVMLTTG